MPIDEILGLQIGLSILAGDSSEIMVIGGFLTVDGGPDDSEISTEILESAGWKWNENRWSYPVTIAQRI